VDSNNWYGIFAPKGTSPADIDRLNQAIRRSLESEGVKSRLLAVGLIGAPGSPAALAALQKADFEKWAGIIKIKAIKGE
jgi:tripartite-type tricarboxylate transporter receptor subunit TctC